MSIFRVQSPVVHIPALVEYHLDGPGLDSRLEVLGISTRLLWDLDYYYVSLVDWGKVLKDVTVGMPKYTVAKFDCENFAMLTAARVSERYRLNTCGIAIGRSPWGEHGYNLLVTEAGLIYFDPQTGDFIPVEDASYQAHLVIFGG